MNIYNSYNIKMSKLCLSLSSQMSIQKKTCKKALKNEDFCQLFCLKLHICSQKMVLLYARGKCGQGCSLNKGTTITGVLRMQLTAKEYEILMRQAKARSKVTGVDADDIYDHACEQIENMDNIRNIHSYASVVMKNYCSSVQYTSQLRANIRSQDAYDSTTDSTTYDLYMQDTLVGAFDDLDECWKTILTITAHVYGAFDYHHRKKYDACKYFEIWNEGSLIKRIDLDLPTIKTIINGGRV